MSTLYDITSRYNNVAELLDNPDVPIEVIEEALSEISDEFNVKADNIARFIKDLNATALSIKEEETRLANRRKAFENRANGLKDYLEANMRAMNVKKVKTNFFSFNIQANPSSVEILDETLIPEEFKTIETVTKIDKKALLKAVKETGEIAGVSLKTSEGLRIR